MEVNNTKNTMSHEANTIDEYFDLLQEVDGLDI